MTFEANRKINAILAAADAGDVGAIERASQLNLNAADSVALWLAIGERLEAYSENADLDPGKHRELGIKMLEAMIRGAEEHTGPKH
jgi:hypothetical protein